MATLQSSPDAVVIAGGGFAGLFCALAIRERLPERTVVLVEPQERFVFQPLLYELLSGELQSWEVAPPYRELLSSRRIVWLQDKVAKIDLNAAQLTTTGGHQLGWGDLVLATGTESNDFGIPGVRDNAGAFRGLADVGVLRERIRQLRLQRQREAALVIVGAGPTGVELACKAADLLEGAARVHLIEMGEQILPRSSSFNREKAVAALERRQVKLQLSTAVTSATNDRINLSDGTTVLHNGLIWSAGSRPSIPTITPSVSTKTGIEIGADLRIKDHPHVFAIGDSAHCPENPWPSTAQVAMQQGTAVAEALNVMNAGGDPEPFQFQDRGEMLSLGLGDATLTGMGVTLAGPLAFTLRRATYLTRLPGLSLGLRSAGAWFLNR